ncbi:preprotein translocase subunit SecG [Fidelibacter multiformis]|jgi:preprotein translocase subunit SecG|uniref:preprotein translocase subunit SecG n=1 Tax=Fidelibacter multiformis TaxID=3377529 RepID=UPI0037DC975F
MLTFVIIILVIVSLLLVSSILMQSSKGGGLGGSAFGGGMGGLNSVLGGRNAAGFLAKATQYLAIAFFILIILINFMVRGSNAQRSVVQEQAKKGVVTSSSSLPRPSGIDIEEPEVPAEE